MSSVRSRSLSKILLEDTVTDSAQLSLRCDGLMQGALRRSRAQYGNIEEPKTELLRRHSHFDILCALTSLPTMTPATVRDDAYTTRKKFLGADFGMAVGVPIVNTPVSLPRLSLGVSPTGVGDMYVEPINLGWKRKKADVKVAYGFVAPTGRYGATSDKTTTDYWGHEITFASTTYLDKTKLTQFSFNTNWEFHQKKRHEDLKVGNNMTLEAGVGKIFVKNEGKQLIQVGAVGYAEFQLTNDSGTAVPVLTANNKDRVFAIGPELGVILPTKKFNFLVRVLPEVGARNRPQGVTVVFAVGKSF